LCVRVYVYVCVCMCACACVCTRVYVLSHCAHCMTIILHGRQKEQYSDDVNIHIILYTSTIAPTTSWFALAKISEAKGGIQFFIFSKRPNISCICVNTSIIHAYYDCIRKLTIQHSFGPSRVLSRMCVFHIHNHRSTNLPTGLALHLALCNVSEQLQRAAQKPARYLLCKRLKFTVTYHFHLQTHTHVWFCNRVCV